MMVVSVVDSWSRVFPVLWRQRRLLLRGNVRRWNARQMGQMGRRRRNLMRGRRWRRRVTHVLLLLGWLRRMSVNHPAPATEPSRSFRMHFYVWGFNVANHESLLLLSDVPVFLGFHYTMITFFFSTFTTVIGFNKLITFLAICLLSRKFTLSRT